MYFLKWSRQSQRYLSSIPKEHRKLIVKQVRALRSNPLPRGTKKIRGKTDNVFRIRIGKYRAIYEMNTEEIIIIKIDKRSKIYK